MSVGFKHHDSGYAVPAKLQKAEELLLEGVTVDHSHQVPFCAGMSDDGKTLYIDHEIPEVVGDMHILKTIVVHELVEHCLMRMAGLPYEEAHQIATAAEEACVRANGWPMHEYNAFWDRAIRKAGSRGSYDNIPQDLDTEPYDQDDEKAEEEGKLDHGLFGHG